MSLEIASLQHKISAANVPLERLAGSTKISEQEKIAEVSRQFEAVLLKQILAQAQKPMFGEALGFSGAGSAIYQDMITQQMADRISQGGSFGFAKVLEKELTSRYVKKNPKEVAPVVGSTTKPVDHKERVSSPAVSAAPAIPQHQTKLRPQAGKRI